MREAIGAMRAGTSSLTSCLEEARTAWLMQPHHPSGMPVVPFLVPISRCILVILVAHCELFIQLNFVLASVGAFMLL